VVISLDLAPMMVARTGDDNATSCYRPF